MFHIDKVTEARKERLGCTLNHLAQLDLARYYVRTIVYATGHVVRMPHSRHTELYS